MNKTFINRDRILRFVNDDNKRDVKESEVKMEGKEKGDGYQNLGRKESGYDVVRRLRKKVMIQSLKKVRFEREIRGGVVVVEGNEMK